MTHQRDRIHEYIATHPGEHFNALTQALDLAPGQVQYHLRKLLNQVHVVEEHLYGRTHYYTLSMICGNGRRSPSCIEKRPGISCSICSNTEPPNRILSRTNLISLGVLSNGISVI